MELISLWHGTSKANHTKILKTGKFKANTYFTSDEKTARQYANMTGSNKPTAMYVTIDRSKLHFDGYYYYATCDIFYKNSIYQ